MFILVTMEMEKFYNSFTVLTSNKLEFWNVHPTKELYKIKIELCPVYTFYTYRIVLNFGGAKLWWI